MDFLLLRLDDGSVFSPLRKPTAFTRLARRVTGQPFYGWSRRAQFAVGRFNGLDGLDDGRPLKWPLIFKRAT